MKTISINLYSFSELSKEAQRKAISNLSDINVRYDWYDSTCEDAKNIGLEITSFDLDRNRHAKGEFIEQGFDVANKIIKEHGETCQTYKTAQKYLNEYKALESAVKNENGSIDTTYFDDEKVEDINEDFLKELLKDYSIILQKECDYLQSEEAIIETIEANEYTFEENGKLRNN